MDTSWLHLLPLLMLVLVFWFSWYYAEGKGCLKWSPFLMTCTGKTHPVYRHYQVRLARQNLYSYDKYEIWRYIERRRGFTESPKE